MRPFFLENQFFFVGKTINQIFIHVILNLFLLLIFEFIIKTKVNLWKYIVQREAGGHLA